MVRCIPGDWRWFDGWLLVMMMNRKTRMIMDNWVSHKLLIDSMTRMASYWEKTRQIWCPGGARVESRLEGIVISIIGLLINNQL